MMLRNKLRSIDPAVQRALLAFIGIVGVGTIAYHFLEGWSYVDAMYFSVITLTTIGYGDMHPVLVATKVFTIIYSLLGVGLVFYIFTSITKHFFETEQKEIKRIEHDIEDISHLLHRSRSKKI